MTSKEKRKALNKFKILKGIEQFDKYYLPYIHPVKFNKGEVVYHKGDVPDSIFLIA